MELLQGVKFLELKLLEGASYAAFMAISKNSTLEQWTTCFTNEHVENM